MRVLIVSSEAYPLAKTGGLADVSAALPMALADLGVDIRLVMPGYDQALATVSAMLDGLDRALALYRQPIAWHRMQTAAMTQDFGWDASARRYMAVYRKLAPHARPSAISEEQMRELPVV